MRIIEWPEFLEKSLPLDGKASAVTVGVFDGVHRGHKALIDQVMAQKSQALPVVVTFRQSQYKKAQGQEYFGEILSFRQKMDAFESLGISITVLIEFSESFRRLTGREFLQILQEQGKMRFLAVGSNFRCGYQLDTDAPAMQKFNTEQNIPTVIVPVLAENTLNGTVTISSSRIRAAIARGELKSAALMLGYPFTLDLAGAPVSSTAHGRVYDISALGRVFPPSGKYAVCLLGNKGGQDAKVPAEVTVSGKNIVIDRNLAEGGWLEYVEFLPS